MMRVIAGLAGALRPGDWSWPLCSCARQVQPDCPDTVWMPSWARPKDRVISRFGRVMVGDVASAFSESGIEGG